MDACPWFQKWEIENTDKSLAVLIIPRAAAAPIVHHKNSIKHQQLCIDLVWLFKSPHVLRPQ
jgi:hypothetical protein